VRADLFLLLGIGAPLLAIALALRLAVPAPRGLLALRVMLATLIPIVLLSAYLVLQYQSWRWKYIEYGSTTPHLVAASAFLFGLGVVLWKAPMPWYAKLTLVILTIPSWAILMGMVAFSTACAMGDCL
jgi:hypothetical protein